MLYVNDFHLTILRAYESITLEDFGNVSNARNARNVGQYRTFTGHANLTHDRNLFIYEKIQNFLILL